jgi:signal transduction histidine kinase
MKRPPLNFSQLYQEALLTHLKQGRQANPESARGLGSQALASGLQTLDLAKLHEKTLVMEVLPGYPANKRAALVKRAGTFFAAVVAPAEKTDSSVREAVRREKIIESLSQRTVELAASNLQLSREITRRKAVEGALKKSERHCLKSLERSELLKEEMQELSRQILSAQEDERKKISRELHDVIAQTLMGINVRLAALKKEAGINTKGLGRNIDITQQLVVKSANIVHQFARELRPTVLDDLGLIPALHAFLKSFMTRTGVRAHLTAFAGVEKLDADGRAVLFRVAQEALTNVDRHAGATSVKVVIRKHVKGICMIITDDGKSFQVQPVLSARGSKRLGLLGMRERVEMVGGCFHIESAPGKGTSITAQIPLGKAAGRTPKSAA